MSALACLAGDGAKATIAVAPLIVVLHDRIFVDASWRRQWLRRRRLYAAYAVALFALALQSWDARRTVGFAAGVEPAIDAVNQYLQTNELDAAIDSASRAAQLAPSDALAHKLAGRARPC